MRFGMKLVTLKHRLKAQANGKPKLATRGLDLRKQVQDMGLHDLGDLWAEARMDEVLMYLRGNTRLALPSWARPLLPTAV